MAFSVTAVSIRVSPLATDEARGLMLTTSAPSRLPASSKELWVRVEASKKRLIRVRPLSRSSFLACCAVQRDEASARSSSSRDLHADRDRRWKGNGGAGTGRSGARTSSMPGAISGPLKRRCRVAPRPRRNRSSAPCRIQAAAALSTTSARRRAGDVGLVDQHAVHRRAGQPLVPEGDRQVAAGAEGCGRRRAPTGSAGPRSRPC